MNSKALTKTLKKIFLYLVTATLLITATSFSLYALTVEDPQDDTFGTNAVKIDILSTDVQFDSNYLYFGCTLASPVFEADTGNPSDLYGYIDLDVDQDPSTGTTALSDYYNGSSKIGMDYYLELMPDSTPGYVALKDSNAKLVGNVEIVFNGNSFAVTIPLNMINNDDGYIDYTAFVGDAGGPDDVTPNSGFATNKTTDPGGGCFINTVDSSGNNIPIFMVILLSGLFISCCLIIIRKKF